MDATEGQRGGGGGEGRGRGGQWWHWSGLMVVLKSQWWVNGGIEKGQLEALVRVSGIGQG